MHRKIHEHVREVVTIHKNYNRKKYFLELHFFDLIVIYCFSLQLKVFSENPLSARVILPKKMNHTSFQTYFKANYHASPFIQMCCILEKFDKFYFFATINQEEFAIVFKENSENLSLSKSDNLKKDYLDVFYLDVHRIWETNIKLQKWSIVSTMKNLAFRWYKKSRIFVCY